VADGLQQHQLMQLYPQAAAMTAHWGSQALTHPAAAVQSQEVEEALQLHQTQDWQRPGGGAEAALGPSRCCLAQAFSPLLLLLLLPLLFLCLLPLRLLQRRRVKAAW
jgi:hypothetical protein